MKPRLSIIVAKSQNNVIGFQNRLPWHLPSDLKRFRKLTMGHSVIMGRKTYESISKPLAGRLNIVLTRSFDFHAEGCRVVRSMPLAIEAAEGREEVFFIGGSEIYRQALPLVSRMYLTQIQEEFKGDAFFPAMQARDWQVILSEFHAPDEENRYPYEFQILERRFSPGSAEPS